MTSKTQSFILGGLVAGLLSTSYLGYINVICCIGVIAGALTAVWHYTTTYDLTIPSGEGAGMGAVAGLIGAGLSTVLNLVLMAIGIRHDLAVSEFMLGRFGDQMAPEQYDQMMAMMEQPFTMGGWITENLVGIVIGLALSAVFGAIGGAIGAKLFKKGGEEVTDPLAA